MQELLEPHRKREVLDKFLGVCRQLNYKKNTDIICPGDSADTLVFVIEGSLTISMEGEDNRRYILAYLNEGEFIGEIGMFVKTPDRGVFIQARTDCVIAKISYALLWNTLENELRDYAIDFLKVMGANLSSRLLQSDRKVLNLTSQDVAGRIIHALKELCAEPGAEPHPNGYKLKITRNELSRIVGCSRERASKALTGLKKKGLIESEGRSIIVLKGKGILPAD
jgi:CRP/FNR family transcriptional regulator, cyclic AMP receptor protein